MSMLGLAAKAMPLVLIVDDDEADRTLCRHVLREAGYSVVEAANAEQGLEHARVSQPDLVVVDFSLPDMDGMAFLANLPLLCPQAGAIMLTGVGSEVLAVRSLKAGVRDYIVKSPHMAPQLQLSVRNTYRDLLTERALNQSRQRHDAMLRAMPDSVLRVSRQGEILEQGSVHMPETAAVAKTIGPATLSSLFGEDVGASIQNAIETSLVGSETVRCEFELNTEAGAAFYDANVAPCGEGQAVVVIRDVTTAKRIRQRLEDALEDAQAATHAKSAFLANMSHEIRTPMNGVLGMAELLQDGSLSEDQTEQVALILQSGRALLQIIDDILDTSKVEAGKFDLEILPFELKALFERGCAMVRVKTRERGNQLTLTFDEDLPRAVAADPNRIQQVLLNYLSNANKFTDAGMIDVSVKLVTEADILYVQCEVRDTGLGIPADKLGRLFLPFSQVDASTRRRFGGTGLGLALSKQLVELMGGSVGVESTLNIGSTFWFRFPCHVASDYLTVSKNISLRPGRSLRVLVAEDNLINQKVTSRLLLALGHDCVVVDNGQKVIDEVNAHQFDVVLMDCHMPELDGYQATRQLRNSAGPGAGIRIIALTASAMPEDRVLAKEAGMDGFLAKPITRAALALALDTCGMVGVRSPLSARMPSES